MYFLIFESLGRSTEVLLMYKIGLWHNLTIRHGFVSRKSLCPIEQLLVCSYAIVSNKSKCDPASATRNGNTDYRNVENREFFYQLEMTWYCDCSTLCVEVETSTVSPCQVFLKKSSSVKFEVSNLMIHFVWWAIDKSCGGADEFVSESKQSTVEREKNVIHLRILKRPTTSLRICISSMYR